MKDQDYTITFAVNMPANKVFKNINNVTSWWTEDLKGNSQKLHDEFSVQFAVIHYSKQKLIELIPDKKVTWLVTESNLSFLEDKQEWNNTKISFELTEIGNQTELHFTHFGLKPEVECYDACTKGWDHFIKGSLFKLLTEGKGTPGLM